ncbi:MAG: hypothetical protein HY852_02045 [Bradyrhizobium sp.]|nr:hypothetical protein [Bradyrhizobium sp.]
MAMLLCLGLVPPAHTKTLVKTVLGWGLIGSWSRDCSLPPDREKGAVLSYEIRQDGRVMYRRDFGDTADENEVVGASTTSEGVLNLLVFFPSFHQTREFGLVKQPDGSMRAIYNHNKNGEYSIKNGKFVSSGQPAPIQHRCSGAST